MAAVVCRDTNLDALGRLLSRMKAELGRRDSDRLNWKKIRHYGQRLTVAQMLGQSSFIQIASVVVCKRHLHPPMKDTDSAYLFTLRFLLERLTWLGKREDEGVKYTLSHVKHFETRKLREYEFKLREMGRGGTEIKWDFLEAWGGRIANDRRVTHLQLADLATSAIARAFEPNRSGPADQSFLLALAPALYRGWNPANSNVLTSYGLKMHPWAKRPDVQRLYPWVSALR